MYICCNCGEDFYRPDEIEKVRISCGIAPDSPTYTLLKLDVCPLCKSEDIYEVDDVWDAEVR